MPHAIPYYVETSGTQKLENLFGSRLERLTQEEKYQLLTAIGLHLWGQCEPVEGESEEDPSFAELLDSESEPDLIQDQQNYLVPEVTASVMSAMVALQNDTPIELSHLLPAIAEYARDDA